MTNNTVDATLQKAARVAGLAYVLIIVLAILKVNFLEANLIVSGNDAATTNNIMANELLFRIGVVSEIIMFLLVVILSLALYVILKTVNKNLALLALLLKLVEATMAAGIVLVSFIALQVLNGGAYITIFTPEQLQVPVGLILNVHTAVFSIPMVFLGLDMMIFSYLFFKSRYIPRILAGFGILSFALIFIHALMYILAPEYAMMPINQIIFWAPSGLFEIIIGIWLLSKGLKVEHP